MPKNGFRSFPQYEKPQIQRTHPKTKYVLLGGETIKWDLHSKLFSKGDQFKIKLANLYYELYPILNGP